MYDQLLSKYKNVLLLVLISWSFYPVVLHMYVLLFLLIGKGLTGGSSHRLIHGLLFFKGSRKSFVNQLCWHKEYVSMLRKVRYEWRVRDSSPYRCVSLLLMMDGRLAVKLLTSDNIDLKQTFHLWETGTHISIHFPIGKIHFYPTYGCFNTKY